MKLSEEEKEAVEILESWKNYNIKNKNKLLKADEIIEVQETILTLISKLQKENELKDKVIEEMAKCINGKFFYESIYWDWFAKQTNYKGNCLSDKIIKIKEYFINKVKGDKE